MARGLPTSGTITLSDVRGAFNYDAANVVGTDTYSTPGYNQSTSTAPAGAVAAKIELWGAGGGGHGYYSLGGEYGGGGGGYTSVIVPVEGGVTNFGLIDVGQGGAGSAAGSANGSSGGASSITVAGTYLTAFGGGGGGTSSLTNGGSGSSDAAGAQNGSASTGGNGTTSAGGAGANGGAGGSTNGANGTFPGGGGAPYNVSTGSGGTGANGQVKITWYGLNTSTGLSLRSYLAGGSFVKPGAAGSNGNIPASGTINLSHFYAAEEVGHYGNTSFSVTSYDQSQGGTASANAVLSVNTTGAYGIGASPTFQNWLRRLLGNDSSTITQYFDVMFNRTSATGYDTTLYGNAANTWYQVSSDQKWWVKATRSSNGTNTSTHGGYLAIRRRSDNVVVANVAITIIAEANVVPAPDTK